MEKIFQILNKPPYQFAICNNSSSVNVNNLNILTLHPGRLSGAISFGLQVLSFISKPEKLVHCQCHVMTTILTLTTFSCIKTCIRGNRSVIRIIQYLWSTYQRYRITELSCNENRTEFRKAEAPNDIRFLHESSGAIVEDCLLLLTWMEPIEPSRLY